MILGGSLLVIAMAITASLAYSFVRIMVDEVARLPKRRCDPISTRARRLVRIVVEPVFGR